MTPKQSGFSDITATTFPAIPLQGGAARAPFLSGCADGLSERDLLGLIIARAGVGEPALLADRLLATFGDMNRVIAASLARLRVIDGMDDAIIAELKLVQACAQNMARARILDRPVISSWAALLDYCHTVMAHRETEQFRVLFLDRKNVLIADEVLGDGTVDQVPVYPREILRRSLELNATALILIHNHPSGDPAPSAADIAMTGTIRQGCAALGITLHDHLIIGKSCEISFRSKGLLDG